MKKWSVVVIIDGYTLKAVGDGTEDGTAFEGRDEDIAMAKAAIRRGWVISLGLPRFSPSVVASYDTPLGLTAALMGAGNSPATLYRAPREVMEYIEEYQNGHNYERKMFSSGKVN